jgi:error-prone DNA polymerase
MSPPAVAELCASSSFSFLEGASSPEELVAAAAELGLRSLALTDRDGVYGLPRAWRRLRELRAQGPTPQLVCGARLTIDEGPGLVLLAQNIDGWANLCRIITEARSGGSLSPEALPPADGAVATRGSGGRRGGRRGGAPVLLSAGPHSREGVEKGHARLPLSRILDQSDGLDIVLTDTWSPFLARRVREAVGERASLALRRRLDSHDEAREAAALRLSRACGLPLLATNEVLYHHPDRSRLQDVLTATRLGCTVEEAGRLLQPNRERCLRGPKAMAALFEGQPQSLARGVEVADRCTFTLDALQYRYPREVVPEGLSPMAHLRALCGAGLAERYPRGPSQKVVQQVEYELGIIERLDFAAYFLTVHDTVRFARARGILCQGRGSAANSAVCFVLGVTAVDPASSSLLFERFISEERGEPPDIDVDFEHERREELIQYIYEKYGRHRAAMVCNIITWRRRSAIRDCGKALGLSLDQVDRMARKVQWFDGQPPTEAQLREAGVDPSDRRVHLTVQLAEALRGQPRHLGLHSGGFTISDGPIVELCPVEPATMAGRTVLQWDKDDIDTVGFVKVDLLALGMLTALRRGFDFIAAHWGRTLDLASAPGNDPAVFDMLCRADSVGVFQIESRAQMSMLPRLRPRCWYDLVIEVSIVRPGPIQGGMVHPFLRRRNGEEPITYAHPLLQPILERTAGVPIFQEQVMAMAVAVGGFTPGEADELRRAMGAWRKRGGLQPITDRLMAGMQKNGITEEYAKQIANQIQGFGEYGFPESHAASFARLVYVSCWMKCHYPVAFTAALLNSQPMGFYSPRSLIGDLRRHGEVVLPVHVLHSDWDCTLEPVPGAEGGPPFALRLGLRQVGGLTEAAGRSVVEARAAGGPFADPGDVLRRTTLRKDELERLVRAGALEGMGEDRRQTLWATRGLFDLPLFRGLGRQEGRAPLPAPAPLDLLREDLAHVGLSLDHDPIGLMRGALQESGAVTIAALKALPGGRWAEVAGVVSNRQRPQTASGVLFMTLEDETGMLNVVVKPKTFEEARAIILGANMLRVRGRVQREGDSLSLLAVRFTPIDEAQQVKTPSRDFR